MDTKIGLNTFDLQKCLQGFSKAEQKSEFASFCHKLSQVPLCVPEAFQTLLCTVKAIPKISTLSEVLEALKDYIFKNQLFDKAINKHHIIHCENDPLKDIFRVSSFSLYNVKIIVLNVLFTENANKVRSAMDQLVEENVKRKAEVYLSNMNKRVCPEPTTEESTSVIRENQQLLKSRIVQSMEGTSSATLINHNLLKSRIVQSTEGTSSATLSNHVNISSEETVNDKPAVSDSPIASVTIEVCDESSSSNEFAKVEPSSDEWSCFDDDDIIPSRTNVIAVNEMYDIEYEVESDSSALLSVTDSNSEIEDIIKVAAVNEILRCDSDEEFWADRSSDELYNDSDVEITLADKWKCKTCGGRNKPTMRFCLKCWEERHGWTRGTPREERLKPRKKRKRKAQSSQESIKSQELDTSITEPSTSQDFTSSQESTTAGDDTTTDTSNLCIICFKKPKNASIVHGNIGHQFSCYRCARKLLSLNKPCPICRKHIGKVIHNYLM